MVQNSWRYHPCTTLKTGVSEYRDCKGSLLAALYLNHMPSVLNLQSDGQARGFPTGLTIKVEGYYTADYEGFYENGPAKS